MSMLIKNIAKQLQQEHQMIGATAKELKDLVERPVSPHEEQSSWLNSVRDSLLSLGSHLKTHFAFEEFGGFKEEAKVALAMDKGDPYHRHSQIGRGSQCVAGLHTKPPALSRSRRVQRHFHREIGNL